MLTLHFSLALIKLFTLCKLRKYLISPTDKRNTLLGLRGESENNFLLEEQKKNFAVVAVKFPLN